MSALRKELGEAEEALRRQEAAGRALRGKLEARDTELGRAESALAQARRDLTLHQDKLKKTQDDTENRVRHLEELIARLQVRRRPHQH